MNRVEQGKKEKLLYIRYVSKRKRHDNGVIFTASIGGPICVRWIIVAYVRYVAKKDAQYLSLHSHLYLSRLQTCKMNDRIWGID